MAADSFFAVFEAAACRTREDRNSQNMRRSQKSAIDR